MTYTHTCKSCGSVLEPEWQYCENCGSPVTAPPVEVVRRPAAPPPPARPSIPRPVSPVSKKTGRPAWLLPVLGVGCLILLCICVLVAAGVYYFWNLDTSNLLDQGLGFPRPSWQEAQSLWLAFIRKG